MTSEHSGLPSAARRLPAGRAYAVAPARTCAHCRWRSPPDLQKVWSSAICLSVNSWASMRRSAIAPMLSPSRSIGTLKMLETVAAQVFLPSRNSAPSINPSCVDRRPVDDQSVTEERPMRNLSSFDVDHLVR